MSEITSEKLEHVKETLLRRRVLDPETGCWNWPGAKYPNGYGIIFIARGRSRLSVHRLAAHIWLGFDIDSKKLICHHCDNPACFNPTHLFVGDARLNILDCIKKGRPFGRVRLTGEDIRLIRKTDKSGVSNVRLAGLFGVSDTLISYIRAGKIWRHILSTEGLSA